MARRVLPSRLELKSRDGSASEAPLANVSFTLSLYVSPVQMIPSCDHTGTPARIRGLLAILPPRPLQDRPRWISVRMRASDSPRQSFSFFFLASMDGPPESSLSEPIFFFMP